MKMSLDPRHLACGGVSVINIFSFGMYDSRRGSHGNTVVFPCQWFITLYMLPVSSMSVDWTGRKSQGHGVAKRNQSVSVLARGIKLLLSLFSKHLKGQHSRCLHQGYLT